MEKKEALQALQAECLGCRECPLSQSRHNVVFGVGDPESELMFIGEGPGENEDLQGEPFVGAAGKLLDDMLEMIDLRRQQVYIANVVKCRPPRNRDPLGEEQAACRHWLDAQREIIRPKLIVCLGRIAAAAVIRSDFRITREHGQFEDVDGVRAMAMYHPAALLRDPSKRPETFVDLMTLRSEARRICQHLYTE
ncbi:MAG: uracil-DNA glycosylase [Oscillospiraceae bacterium]|nr:uracil-DNA glycosylase [Oscillospiraceae bacterium]